jgi:inner membrane protein
MDILTHIISGLAVGTVVSGFSKNGLKENLKLICFSGFGGAFPDFDAISLWSGFDKTFGRLFGLSNAGKTIYFSKFWYSHHGFFHSVCASLLLALCIGLGFYAIQKLFIGKKNVSIADSFKGHSLLLFGFIAGYMMHLFEDMPTPSCVWDGVRILWPLKIHTGGTGDIWWWNNYDIFIIATGVLIINVLILILKRVIRVNIEKLTIVVFIIGFMLCVIQIKSRGYNFNYTGQTVNFQQYEQKSKDIQKRILGDKLYNLMVKLDKRIKVNF